MNVSVSILDCDFRHLKDELEAVVRGGADAIHLDVMDGHFVPNLSFGVPLARAVRQCVAVPVRAHLMVLEPEWLVEKFLPYADRVIFHVEATELPDQCLETILGAGRSAGISLNPGTPVERLEPFLGRVDEILVMSVHPGLGGQQFIPESLDRIRRIRALVAARAKEQGIAPPSISVDGGVNSSNCRSVAAAGATTLVAGSAVFRSPDYAAAIKELKCSDS
ncbi:ribulose-phosphate 3-epimerase [candidate division WOR-3 bacterium]|nr:ribulose-phosphate 3-epimerase [candidate division WOR-3 bacterium]